MSTNYYAHGEGITDPEGLHIGQAAAGSRFLFRAWPDRGLVSAAAWSEFLHQPGIRIRDGYGLPRKADQVMTMATRATDGDGLPLRHRYAYGPRRPEESVDIDGNAFYDGEFC